MVQKKRQKQTFEDRWRSTIRCILIGSMVANIQGVKLNTHHLWGEKALLTSLRHSKNVTNLIVCDINGVFRQTTFRYIQK